MQSWFEMYFRYMYTLTTDWLTDIGILISVCRIGFVIQLNILLIISLFAMIYSPAAHGGRPLPMGWVYWPNCVYYPMTSILSESEATITRGIHDPIYPFRGSCTCGVILNRSHMKDQNQCRKVACAQIHGRAKQGLLIVNTCKAT